jgi:hypothetical protein
MNNSLTQICRSGNVPDSKRNKRKIQADRIRAGIRSGIKPQNVSDQKWDDIQILLADIDRLQEDLDKMGRQSSKDIICAEDRDTLKRITVEDAIQQALRELWKELYGVWPRTHLMQMVKKEGVGSIGVIHFYWMTAKERRLLGFWDKK